MDEEQIAEFVDGCTLDELAFMLDRIECAAASIVWRCEQQLKWKQQKSGGEQPVAVIN